MVTSLYIISDPPNQNMGRYKVGAWFNDKEKLIGRYITSHPELQIFYYVNTPKAYDVELIFKKRNKDKRIRNIRGRRSEWFVMSVDEIIQQLNYLIATDLEVYPEYKYIRTTQSIDQHNLMFLDNFDHPCYEETRLLNVIEAKILKQKFKNEGLSKDETALLDKWFFTQLVSSEYISTELFNQWLVNRKIFFHVYFEKHSNLSVKLANKYKKYYRCLSNLSIDQVNIIRQLNQLIGIQCSCQPFQFYEKFYPHLWSQLSILIHNIDTYFKFTSLSNNQYEVISKRLIKIYNYWADIFMNRIRHRNRINGREKDNYLVNSDGNLELYIKIKGNDYESTISHENIDIVSKNYFTCKFMSLLHKENK